MYIYKGSNRNSIPILQALQRRCSCIFAPCKGNTGGEWMALALTQHVADPRGWKRLPVSRRRLFFNVTSNPSSRTSRTRKGGRKEGRRTAFFTPDPHGGRRRRIQQRLCRGREKSALSRVTWKPHQDAVHLDPLGPGHKQKGLTFLADKGLSRHCPFCDSVRADCVEHSGMS